MKFNDVLIKKVVFEEEVKKYVYEVSNFKDEIDCFKGQFFEVQC